MKLAEIAVRLGCDLDGDGDLEISGLAPIDRATPGSLAFVSNPRYLPHLETTQASAVIVAKTAPVVGVATLRADDPYLAFAEAIDLFYVPPPRPDGIHPSAVIAASARVAADARIGAHCVVGEKSVIGPGACLDAHVVIYPEVEIGADFHAYANVVVRERVQIGNRVTLQPGCVIGSDGFGYTAGRGGTIRKIVQAGTVVLEDDVEVGANTTIDRAAIGETRLGRGVKIDNLVQIAHGCSIGEGSMLAAQVGMSGSTRVGRYVRIGGQAATAGHLSIGDGASVAARTGVTSDTPAGQTVGGFPAQAISAWRRTHIALPRLPEALRRLRRLEQRLGLGKSRDED